MNNDEIIIKIDEIENKIEAIYKFNKDNNDTIANLFEIEKKRLDNYIEKNNNEINDIKNIDLLLLLLMIIISFRY